MSKKSAKVEYLIKAHQAETIAAQFAESFLKSSWLSIAAGYRELAEAEEPTISREKASPTSPTSPQK